MKLSLMEMRINETEQYICKNSIKNKIKKKKKKTLKLPMGILSINIIWFWEFSIRASMAAGEVG